MATALRSDSPGEEEVNETILAARLQRELFNDEAEARLRKAEVAEVRKERRLANYTEWESDGDKMDPKTSALKEKLERMHRKLDSASSR